MKLFQKIAVGGLAVAALAGPAAAQRDVHSVTTVTRVHGPLKVLPHHKRKICRTRIAHGHGSRKCWYH